MTDKSISTSPQVFSLIRLKPHCKIPPTRADFTPPPLLPYPTTTYSTSIPSITPVFNHDQCHFTPAFVLPADKKYYTENTLFQRDQFEDKLRKAISFHSLLSSPNEPSSIQVAIPKTNYCQLCQDNYEDYHTHIHTKSHRLRISNSEGALLVQQLCTQFQKSTHASTTVPKQKMIRKERRRDQKQLEKRGTTVNRTAPSEQSTGPKPPNLLSISELGDTLA